MPLPRIEPIRPTWRKDAFDHADWRLDAKYDGFRDGEVIAADETGRPQFYDLLRGALRPAYIAFDLLLRPMPLSERRRVLHSILPANSPTIAEAVSAQGRGIKLFELICAHDLEGIVAKRLADPYEPRVRWLKIKNRSYSQAEGRGDFSMGRPGELRRVTVRPPPLALPAVGRGAHPSPLSSAVDNRFPCGSHGTFQELR